MFASVLGQRLERSTLNQCRDSGQNIAVKANIPKIVTTKNPSIDIAKGSRAGARVVLAGMTLPPNYGPDYIHGFENIYKDLAAKHKLTLIPFLMGDIVSRDLRYIQPDGIHPTAEGAEIISGTVLRAIKPLLGTAKN
jgi:acyl-CoA thioesterase-1